MEDREHHLSLALNKITSLNRRMFRLENQTLWNESGLQVTFMVSEYSYKNRNSCRHDCEGSHLLVYLKILHGPHDDQLDWPLKGTFIIELLNQLEDKIIIRKL